MAPPDLHCVEAVTSHAMTKKKVKLSQDTCMRKVSGTRAATSLEYNHSSLLVFIRSCPSLLEILLYAATSWSLGIDHVRVLSSWSVCPHCVVGAVVLLKCCRLMLQEEINDLVIYCLCCCAGSLCLRWLLLQWNYDYEDGADDNARLHVEDGTDDQGHYMYFSP